MLIETLDIQTLDIPFKVNFKHASADRKVTQSILVRATSTHNTVGYGEGCPREYVSNESLESCLIFFEKYKPAFLELNELEKVKKWVDSNEALIDKNPAAWCAVELALLDLLAKSKRQSVEALLGISEISDVFTYSAILGDSSPEITKGQIDQFAQFDLTDFKLKISGNLLVDKEKINQINKRITKKHTIRLDANNLWGNASACMEYFSQIKTDIFAVEEPLTPFDYKGMEELSRKFNIKIILDESFLNVKHFDPILEHSSCYVINLRVSKMGGILRSLQISKRAEEQNIPIIIGAQVGETSILTRAALTIAQASRANLLFQEGAYGTLLLAHDIVKTPLMFGQYGHLNAQELLDLNEYGFQLKYDFSHLPKVI